MTHYTPSAAIPQEAGDDGPLLHRLPLANIVSDHLTRDRLQAGTEDLEALAASIRAHGQRTPIEVMRLADGRFGLISGWRRLTALRQLASDPGGEGFATVLAQLRQPQNAADAYVSMVEENEIRVGLSYYERARLVALVVEQGVFETEKIALAHLFAAASRAKRSKIRSFLKVFHGLDDLLSFPSHLTERQGLALARALACPYDGAAALRARLQASAPADTPAGEQIILQDALDAGQAGGGADADQAPDQAPANGTHQLCPGVFIANEGGFLKRRIVLSGPKVDQAFQARLECWLSGPIPA